MEEYSQSNTLKVHGIPTEKNETVLSILKEIGRVFNLDISDLMSDSCHILGNKRNGTPPGIIVKFVRCMDKKDFIRK